jgi:hypothetical protein
MIRRLILAALMALPAGLALAQNVTGEVTAICRPGQGCQCADALDPQDVIWVHFPDRHQEPLPPGWAGDVRNQTVVIDLGSGQVYRSGRSRAEINAAYGGDGPCEPAPRPVADIVPRDGVWQWRTLGETAQGCPDMLAGMLAANRVETLTQRVVWGGAFHPDRLADSLPRPEMGGMSPYDWRRLGPNRWLADNVREGECSDGTCVEVALALGMNVASPERLTGLLSLRSRVQGPQAAILAQFGMADCRVRVRYEIRRIGE